MTMGSVTAGPNAASSLEAVSLDEITHLISMFPIVDREGKATQDFQVRFQRVISNLVSTVNATAQQVSTNTAVIAGLQAAQAKAEAANDNATRVQTRVSLSESWTDPANPLTATNDGTITIAAHKRYYDAQTYVNVNSGTITGCTQGEFARVYYMDAGREGGAVSYACTNQNVAQAGDVHVVGGVTVPNAGEPQASGGGVVAPGNVAPPSGGYSGDYLEP